MNNDLTAVTWKDMLADAHIEFALSSSGTVSPLIFGTNIEHTRSCLNKGLSAQMLRNRKFVGKPEPLSGHAAQWYRIGEKTVYVFDDSYTRHHRCYHMTRRWECFALRAVNPVCGHTAGVGQHELAVTCGTAYEFRMVARTTHPADITVSLTSRHGKQAYAAETIHIEGDTFKTYETVLIPDTTDADADLVVTFDACTAISFGAFSLMPADHFHGMRKDVIHCLKALGVRMLRWPGGNFAGEYNWLDGLLPRDMRAPFESYLGIETQPQTMGYDFHEVGIDEFIALCRELGAEPFITINPAWNTPEENGAWVEYCNGDTGTHYGALRAARGHKDPYNVKYWSLGNEFGYGHMEGENTPQGYARIARANAEKMLAADPDIMLCSSGPYPSKLWSDASAAVLSDVAPLASQHYYAHVPAYPDACHFRDEYEATVQCVLVLQDELTQGRSYLPDNVKISMDEWNVWYAWNRPSSVTDGMFAALTLHMLLSQANPLGIHLCCHFEAINEGLIAAYNTQAHLTAQGQMFALMGCHRDGQILLRGIDRFATRNGDLIHLTVINPSFDTQKTVTLPDGKMPLSARLFSCDQVIPPSYFEEADVKDAFIAPAFTMPPHSVLYVTLNAQR